MAHVDLAKAELAQIGGEVARVAALGGIAVALVIVALTLLVIGTSLFLGEWILGSLGWGVLDGVLFFVAIAMTCVLLAVGIAPARIVRALAAAIVLGVLTAIVLVTNLPNRLYTAIGDSLGLAVDPGTRPLVVGILLGGLVGLVVGIILAVRMQGAGGGRAGVVVGSTVVGVLVGAFTSITFGPQVGVGIGLTIGYIAWMAIMGRDVARTGIDVEALRLRFYPTTTIETSKETLEWLQRRMPPGIG